MQNENFQKKVKLYIVMFMQSLKNKESFPVSKLILNLG